MLATRQRTVLLVDDHPVFRAGLAQLLDQERDLRVVGDVADHRSAMQLLQQQPVDLVLLDLSLGESSGLSLLKSIHAQWPERPVLVVSMHDEKVYAERVFHAGAQGYVRKDQPWEVLLGSIRAVLAGQLAYSGSVARALLNRRPTGPEAASALSDREMEVFDLLGVGLRVREIAERLVLSPKTVESHIASIKRKLGIQHANELVHRATLWVLSQEDATLSD